MANRPLHYRGQARIMEAIIATIIILVLAALMPMLFKSPTTQLPSQVESNLESYAENALSLLINNPQFLSIIQNENWGELDSLMNSIVGPQYDWYVAVIPYGRLLTLSSIVKGSKYVLIPITTVPMWNYSSPIPIPLTDIHVSELTLNVYLLNFLLSTVSPNYFINTTLPLSNVAFIQCANQSLMSNITACIESRQVRMLRWWVTYFDPRTGTAVVWVNATGNMYIVVSANGTLPYNVISGTYCSEPYCFDMGLGGLSNLMNTVYGASYNNEPQFINYVNSNVLSCSISNGVKYGSNYLVELLTNGIYYNVPSSVGCSATVNAPYEPYGYHVYMIGQLITAIPDSFLELTFNNIEVEPYIVYPNGTVNVLSTYQVGSIGVELLYGSNAERMYIIGSSGILNKTMLNQYSYLYLLDLGIEPTISNGVCYLNINVTLYDLVTTSNYNINASVPVGSCSNALGINVTIGGISIAQQSQNPQGNTNYTYNTTTIVYDLWFIGTPTTTQYMPIYVNYEFQRIDALNIIPPNYREKFAINGFSPTASAFAVVQLGNSSYYLVYIGLSSLSR
ncbi:hypothetical protein [Vulcanisaeta moutnovskia]|nr:hypothetical protein [Vulcanisaeta moutnovskia]